jgi:hypothetical protein
MASDFLSVISELFSKIASFFDVFDLSFFVSGSLCLAAISFWFKVSGINYPFALDNWMRIFELIVFCYVLGLITFTSGRWLRTGFVGRKLRCLSRKLNVKISGTNTEQQKDYLNSREYFVFLLDNHGINEREFIKNYNGCGSNPHVADCLYQRMWAEIRQCSALSPSLTLLNRWWVMAATYDGIAMNFIFYALIIVIWLNGMGLNEEYSIMIREHPYYEYSFVAILILSILSIASFREAGRLEINQRAEIVATMAHFCSNAKYQCEIGEEEKGKTSEKLRPT